MGIDIVILHARPDAALADRIATFLRLAGHTPVCCPDDTPPAPLAARGALLWLWTVASVASPAMRAALLASKTTGGAIDICIGGIEAPPAPRKQLPLLLKTSDADLQPLLARLHAVLGTDDPFAASEAPRMAIAPSAPSHPPTRAAAGSGRSKVLDRSFGAASKPRPAEVLLAASAPRNCAAGNGFTACLVAYVEAARASALRRLEQFGESGDRIVSDLAPDGDARWRVGAPITVRAAGPHLSVTPAERRFEWNGRENAAAFAVVVDAAAPAGSVELCFAVEVAGVTMAFIPMRIAVGLAAGHAAGNAPAADRAPLPPLEIKAPRSVFASYASKDAQAVVGRLSTLLRWSPGLDIFQDCLDLVPDEAFKPQLALQIRTRDAFVLFWSRHAAASPWVRWEYATALETARDGKGLATILPMPLEDPAIAPPPPEFADAHWRDRFMLAGYALAKIRDISGEAAGP